MTAAAAAPVGFLCRTLEGGLRLYGRVARVEKGSYRVVRLVRRFRPRETWQSIFRTPQGLAMDLDMGTYPDCSMAFGVYEVELARLMLRLLRPGDHFVDGGANIGYLTMLAARRVGPQGRVDAFEPQPDNRARLAVNLRRNNLAGQVTVHGLALSDREGEAQIHFFSDPGQNHGSSSLFAEPGLSSRATPVRTVRMDRILTGTRPRLVKLDVEGAEPLVIDGMTELLRSPRPPAVIVEYNPHKARIAGFEPRAVVDRLLAAQPSYRVYRVGWRVRPMEPTTEALDRMGQGDLLFQCP